jgi:hypothetical protein
MSGVWGNRGAALLLSLMLGSAAGGSASSQTVKGADMDDLFAVLDRLQVGIPMGQQFSSARCRPRTCPSWLKTMPRRPLAMASTACWG